MSISTSSLLGNESQLNLPDPPLTNPPSVPRLSPPSRSASHLPSHPSASHSDSSSEDPRAFEDHEGSSSSNSSASRSIHRNPFDLEFDRAYGGSESGASTCSTAPTSPMSSHDVFQGIPVSLPIDAPEWTEIFATSSGNHDARATERFVGMVTRDSARVMYLKDIRVLREQNRLANRHDEPLTPVPNLSGQAIPPGYSHAITSISQIQDMALTELDSWLLHYDLAITQYGITESTKRLALASHVGVGPGEPNIRIGGPGLA